MVQWSKLFNSEIEVYYCPERFHSLILAFIRVIFSDVMEPVAKILRDARAAAKDRDSLPETDQMFESIAESTKNYMSMFDASHDFSHVLRVVALSQRILAAERQAGRGLTLDSVVIILAAYVMFNQSYYKMGNH